MNSTAPQLDPKDRPAVEIADDFNEEQEVTGVRRKVDIAVNRADYPSRPDRHLSFAKVDSRELEHRLEAQVDKWGEQRMLKTQVELDADADKLATAIDVLERCQNRGKIAAYEVETPDHDERVFTIYYNQHKS